MIIILKETFILKNEKGDVLLEIKGGTKLTVISFEYLPSHAFEGKLDFQIERAKREAYMVYIKSMFIAIPKNLVEVPITVNNGWSYNL